MRIVHASDLHFGEPFRAEAAEAFLASLDGLGADAIVVSGDFTQLATEEEFRAAAAYLERFPAGVPTLVIPGNHDVPQLPRVRDLLTPFRNYRRFIRPELDFVYRGEDAVFVGMNTTTWFGSWVNGWVTERQLATCESVFSDVPDGTLRVAVVHHHLAPAPDYRGGKVMFGAARVARRLLACGVELVLGGHLHRAFIGNTLDFLPGGPTDRGLIVVQSGTTTSRRGRVREREKNSFNVIDTDDCRVGITHMFFDEDAGRFRPIGRHVYPRHAGRYLPPPGEPCDPASRPRGETAAAAAVTRSAPFDAVERPDA